MENAKKTSDSMVLYREKPDFDEQELPKKKKISSIVFWSTRRKTLQSYITITLGLGHMLQFAGAITIYGGIIWIPYMTCSILVGVPLITVEIALAHYVNNDIKFLWQMCPIGKGIFYNCLIATFVATVFSNIYLTRLLHLSIDHKPNLSRASPSDLKSMPECYEIALSNSFGKEHNTTYDHGINQRCRKISSSEKCNLHDADTNFKGFMVDEHEWFSFLYLGLICFVIFGINCMGVRSIEKFTTFLVLVPYLCAVIFLILTLTLPRSINFIQKCLHLNWSKLQEFAVWQLSFEHVINGFAIGTLCFTFVAVHSDFHDDIMVEVVIVFLTDFLNTLLLSLTVLGLMGTLTYEVGLVTRELPIYDLAILECIVRCLAYLPPPKGFWSFLFFTYYTTSVIGSQSFMVASVADAVMSLFKKFRANTFYVTAGLCFIFFVIGSVILLLKIERLPLLDGSFIAIGLLQCITLFWIYNYQKICADFHFLMGYKPSLFYQFIWVISPLIFTGMLIIIISSQESINIITNNALILATISLVIYFALGLCEAYNLWRKGENYNVFKNNISWGPSDPVLKRSRIIFKSRIITKEHIYRQKLYKKQLVKPFDITDQNIVQLQ